jgi:hypothetical protein
MLCVDSTGAQAHPTDVAEEGRVDSNSASAGRTATPVTTDGEAHLHVRAADVSIRAVIDDGMANLRRIYGKEGIEGAVLKFAGGRMYKVKTKWFVRIFSPFPSLGYNM